MEFIWNLVTVLSKQRKIGQRPKSYFKKYSKAKMSLKPFERNIFKPKSHGKSHVKS